MTETMLFGSQPFLEDATAFALDTHFPEVDQMKRDYEARARALVAGLSKAPKHVSGPHAGRRHVRHGRRAQAPASPARPSPGLLDEESVVTMPGESFGAGGAGHLRVALTVDEDQISEACKRIVRLAERV